ncbi:MAG: sigma-70 family RNA polymerase sigma factor [Anaerolineae bacterium]
MHESDRIHRARQGDEGAWTELVREHQAAAFRLAYLLVGDADDAEDVTQEAFIRAYRALDGFDLERPFRPWLLGIVRNLASNWRRSLGRYLAALRRLGRERAIEPRTAPSHDPVREEEARALWRAVRRLKEADQVVIYLRYFLDLPVAETAQILGVAPGTVKSRLHRALRRLRAVVGQEFQSLGEGREA